jgi:hypothetical protein
MLDLRFSQGRLVRVLPSWMWLYGVTSQKILPFAVWFTFSVHLCQSQTQKANMSSLTYIKLKAGLHHFGVLSSKQCWQAVCSSHCLKSRHRYYRHCRQGHLFWSIEVIQPPPTTDLDLYSYPSLPVEPFYLRTVAREEKKVQRRVKEWKFWSAKKNCPLLQLWNIDRHFSDICLYIYAIVSISQIFFSVLKLY